MSLVSINIDYLKRTYFYFDEAVNYQLDNKHFLKIYPVSVKDSEYFLSSCDILKIDKSFFTDMEKNIRAQIIVETIIQMCKRLKITTVAEGIDTKGQVSFLKQIGCDIIQGYYFSKPIRIEEFEEKYLK